MVFLEQCPKLLGAEAGQRMFDVNGSAQAGHIGRTVRSLDTLPAGIGLCLLSHLKVSLGVA
jgi:hypothetical protein